MCVVQVEILKIHILHTEMEKRRKLLSLRGVFPVFLTGLTYDSQVPILLSVYECLSHIMLSFYGNELCLLFFTDNF